MEPSFFQCEMLSSNQIVKTGVHLKMQYLQPRKSTGTEKDELGMDPRTNRIVIRKRDKSEDGDILMLLNF